MRYLLLLFALASSLFAADPWKVGFNFRHTAGYVTDGADEIYVLNAESATRSTANGNSATFAITGGDEYNYLHAPDESASVDARLSGSNWTENNLPLVVTIALPQAGKYKVRLALGGAVTNYGRQYAYLKDDGTTLVTIFGEWQDSNFYDAGGTVRTAADWPGSNTEIEATFTTTTCQLVLGDGLDGTRTAVAHLYLEYVPPAGGARRRIVVVE